MTRTLALTSLAIGIAGCLLADTLEKVRQRDARQTMVRLLVAMSCYATAGLISTMR